MIQMTMVICAVNSVESLRLIPIHPCDVISAYVVNFCQLLSHTAREREREKTRQRERKQDREREHKTEREHTTERERGCVGGSWYIRHAHVSFSH